MTALALITGGAGFIGSNLAQALLEQGTEVRILDDLSTGRRENLDALPGLHRLIVGDIRDMETVRRAVEGVQVVFHLAAEVSVPRSVADPVRAYEVNATGTVNLLEACVEEGVGRVVFSSSCAVYGDDPRLPKTEDMLPSPLSPYASTKVTGEHLMTMYGRLHGLSAVSLRYFNVYGQRQDPGSEYAAVIPRFIERMSERLRPVIFGDGNQTRDFVHVLDVVTANLAAARADDLSGRVMNVGSGRATSLLKLVSTLNEVMGTSLSPVHEPPRPGDILHSTCDRSLASSLLGTGPGTDLRDGLAMTVEWFERKRRNP